MLSTIEQTHPHLSRLAFQSLEDQVGNTPLINLARVAKTFGLAPDVYLLAKAEWLNPGGSVKDRAALNIIRVAEDNGLLHPGMTILDSTSGNTGIAYAMLGAAKGYRVLLTIPENASPERMAILRAYGAELILTDPLEGVDGALIEARRLAAEDSSLFYANQYNNDANWRAHYLTTANEIYEQTAGQITHFVAGLGTGGTFTGTTRRLKELNPAIYCFSAQPDSPFNGIEGWKHMESAIVPGIYDESLADKNLTLSTEKAYEMARLLARTEGLFVGISAAAAVATAVRAAQDLERGVMVTILPDSGMKYLSERFWSEE
ncbi:MAG: cysteine synthase family protein [Candidatus Promineifilaceae bacterium]|nr:cysteine synthase family protein [Candidatus Promineifilaceae bacterium]